MLSVPGDGYVLGCTLDFPASVEPIPSELWKIDVPVLKPKALGKFERIVNELLFVPGVAGLIPFGVVPGPDFFQFAEEPLVRPVQVDQALLQDLGMGLLKKGKLWSPSYFAGSFGGAPISIIRQYVESQREK